MEEYELHGAHQHHAHDVTAPLGQWIAIFTALVACLGAVVGHEASQVANEALLLKNEAVLKRAEASDQWTYYQQVSTKAQIGELSKRVTGAAPLADIDDKLAKYARQKTEIEAKARALEAEQVKANEASVKLRVPRQHLAVALTLLQIAISVASVTALTNRKWLLSVAGLSAVGGVGFWVASMF